MSVYGVYMNCLKSLMIVLVTVLSLTTNAENQNSYYGSEFYSDSSLKDEGLIRELHKILSNKHQEVAGGMDRIVNDCERESHCYAHSGISYNQAKSFLLSKYYVVPNGSGFMIKDVYCEQEYSVPGPYAVPDSTILNVEHTWPQSKFTGRYGKDLQKADLHHLYPSDSQLNSIRGNYPFGEVEKDAKPLKCNTSRFGSAKNGGQMVFEPPHDHRGNVARALFYFSVRYEINIDDKQEAFLRAWHQEDPVDAEEMTRNEEIFKLQNNRNPFIDMPSLADRIKNF